MSRKQLITVVGIFMLTLAACSSVDSIQDSDGVKALELEVAPVKGALAPDFELEGLDGELVSLSDYRGRVVLVNFWATWCGPCRFEMPALQSRYERYAPEFEILAVDNDESAEAVDAFFKELGLSFKALLDPGGDTQELYRVRGYPSSVFVDADGVIQIIHIGMMTEGQLDGYLLEMDIGDG
ncbi:MAG: redoxin domain-containing protein [Chloroflexi bacterium]|nr:redoxin domain-containing protein [Chloroflexota bacterium]